MAYTVEGVRKSSGKYTFTMGSIKYEFDPVNMSLWRIDGDNYVLAEHLSPADRQLLLNSLNGENLSTSSFPSVGVDTWFGETIPAPKLDLVSEYTKQLGKVPHFRKESVSGVGKFPTIKFVDFDKNVTRPTSNDPFEKMPTDGAELLQFINNAIAMKETRSPGVRRTPRRGMWR